MKIAVDTEKDSPEKIKRVIKILSASLEGKKRRKSQKAPQKAPERKEELLVSFEFTNNSHRTGIMDSNTEVSGMFTDNREEEVKIGSPTVIERVEQEEKSFKKITY